LTATSTSEDCPILS